MSGQHGTPPNKALERTGGEESHFLRAAVAAGRSAPRYAKNECCDEKGRAHGSAC